MTGITPQSDRLRFQPTFLHPIAFALLAVLLAFTTHAAEQSPSAPPRVVIIIDDIGHSYSAGRRAVGLSGAINYAVLPHTPNSSRLAVMAQAEGKEVILHMPMASLVHPSPGTGVLTTDMPQTAFRQALADAFDSVPGCKGLSNHMGSALTAKQEPMRWLMEELRKRDLYFVDSRTTHKTLGAPTAESFGVPHLNRMVFLDNTRTEDAISKEFERLLQLARRHGVAAAIGHPHNETLTFLERHLPTLKERGFELALVSEVLTEMEKIPGPELVSKS